MLVTVINFNDSQDNLIFSFFCLVYDIKAKTGKIANDAKAK